MPLIGLSVAVWPYGDLKWIRAGTARYSHAQPDTVRYSHCDIRGATFISDVVLVIVVLVDQRRMYSTQHA